MRLITMLGLLVLFACNENNSVTKEEGDASPSEVTTPVTVTTISKDTIGSFIDLNAVSTYQLKTFLKANSTGYVQSASVVPGQFVRAGQILFTIRTKEAVSIGNEINKLDSTFKFSGTNVIRSGTSGYINQINHQSGDYVQDGEQLAIINDENSFVFLMELPAELFHEVRPGTPLKLTLPDGDSIPGVISSLMPTVDPAAQTQSVVIKVNTAKKIPENLIAKVRIVKSLHKNAQSLPLSAVLSDETQSDFWVMKMTDSNTAIKVPIVKGLQTSSRVEIVSPVFSDKDLFVTSGNYGLPDTAKVSITSPK